jgi:hypothetical protein
MKLLLAVALFVGVASAWPNFFDQQNQRTSAGVSRDQLLERQVKLLTLLERIHEPSNDVEIKSIAQSFTPSDNPELYSDNGKSTSDMAEMFAAGKMRERGAYFSMFEENQRNQMICFFNCLMNAKTWDTFFKTAAWARERMNEGMFTYGLIAASLNRDDLRGVKFPPPYELNPHFFVPTEVIQEAYRAQMKQTPKTIASGFTGTPKNTEQRVAYFGEDIGMESHHYHWHIDFPFWWDSARFGVKDRKGELFFYMHHQLNARFDAERLSNNLPRVEPISWNEELKEGFAPHATYLREGEFPSRPDNMPFKDLPEVSLADMNRFTYRIRESVDRLFAEGANGNVVSLNNSVGIDVLGSMIESSTSSPNSKFYGSIHNFCHMLLSRITDPEGKYGLPPGVMEHFETSTRDPTFFRLHKFLDEIFRAYKNNLGPYNRDELDFVGVDVEAVKVTSLGKTKNPNTLVTFFDDFEFDLNNALDHIKDREDVPIKALIKRLNNEPFQYNIQVRSDGSRLATVRIFLAPKYESYGGEIALDDKRWEMIELDKFVVKLSAGSNTVTRNSKDSSVTIPDMLSFKTLKQQALDGLNGDTAFKVDENFRHCGLPERLLLPRGTPQGMDFELWVAVTDHNDDKVSSNAEFDVGGSMSYCGQRGAKYPDKRAMGYPWDRPISDLEKFTTTNMKSIDIKIQHVGVV